MIIAFCQTLFTMIYFQVTIPLFNRYLVMGFATIYTMLPVFSLVLNKDMERETCMRFPILYQMMQEGRALNSRTFLSWVWKSIYQVSTFSPTNTLQASVIMLFTILLFNDSFIVLVSVSFTSLIAIEQLNVLAEVNHVE